MRITNLATARVDLPLDAPLRTSIHEIASVTCLLVTLETDEGLTGEGYAFCFGRDRLAVLEAMVDALRPMVIGRDPHQVEALWEDMLRACNFLGAAGVTVIAMTPIDLACWDLVGKAADQPLHRLWGGARERVPAYASGGLWLSSGPEALAAEARGFLDQGFKAMKLRLGAIPLAENLARVEAVRDAIGPDIALMADANQGLTVAEAIRLGRALEPYGLVWFEEPIPTWDHHGHAAIAAAIDTPLASGETEYLRHGLANMIERRSADLLMPDLQRMGGYTEFRRAIGQMAAANLPFSPHIFTEHSLHLATAGCAYVEHMPWFGALFRETMELDADGMIALPDGPGTGFSFDPDAIEPHRF
ncbi:L-alanine-DL-glutamate epimerase [Albimonas donghaensis]|uniref:L-alanine-DL-glutamate epimerase n=1 Tax=Albimonas donghaensis TaxID=356660 RepID=A0A1H3E9L0_9RHOB|nr:mandelate racemase/muconate lactonizing enzyme family protein [Albimonas donghaensis]SDX75345.1 L-alanine-DL-glutamate epimerase [Albimonas donghaensis]